MSDILFDLSRERMSIAAADSSAPITALAASSANAPTISPDDLLLRLWRQRALVGVAVALCLMLATLYLIYAPRLYTATARLYIQDQDPLTVNTDSHSLVERSKNYLATQAELITSTPVVVRALQDPAVRASAMLKDVKDPVAFLQGAVGANVGKKDDIIEVYVDAPTPQEAVQIVNAVINAYVTHQSVQKRTTANEVVKAFTSEKARRDAELSAKVKEMLAFKDANGTISFDVDKGNIVFQTLSQLSDALSAAQLQTMAAGAQYEAAQAMAGNPAALKRLLQSRPGNPGLSADPEAEQMRQQLGTLQLRLAVAEHQLRPEHPALDGARSAIQNLESRIARHDKEFVTAYFAAAKADWDSAKHKEEELRTAVAQQQKRAIELNNKTAQYTLLDAEIKRIGRVIEGLDVQIKQASVAASSGALDITVLEPAQASDLPTKPRKIATLALGLMLGLMLGTGAALVRVWTDQTLRSAGEIQAALGMPVLCAIPRMPGVSNALARAQVVHLDPHSQCAEAFRTMRTAVEHQLRRAEAKILLVASPSSGDGKSTIVSNLAIAMAQAGQRVLIIDADLRAPSMHAVFRAPSEGGLCGVLSNGEPLEAAICATSIAHLDLLPAGSVPSNPSELLEGRDFVELLGRLTCDYDRILVDSPAVLPIADARSLAAACDRTLLVLRPQTSTRKLSEQTCAALAGVGARIVGIVVNDVPPGEWCFGNHHYAMGARLGVPRLGMPIPTNGGGSAQLPVIQRHA